MTAFKALVIKDLQTNKKALLVTVWIVLALYVLLAGTIIAASLKSPNSMSIGGIPLAVLSNPDISKAISFALQVGLFFGFLGFMFGIQMISVSAFLLNSDVKHKCELFHRSQPVSVWQITGSRFVAGIGGVIGLTLAFGILQYLVGSLILAIMSPLHVNWWMGLNGMLLSWLHLSVSMLTLGAIGFLLSAIFRDNAFGKGALIIGATALAVIVLNYFLNLGIPSPIKALTNLVISNIRDFTSAFPTMQYGVQFGNSVNSGNGIEAFTLPTVFLSTLWSTLFTWGIALKLAISGLLYVLATCLYQRREVQF